MQPYYNYNNYYNPMMNAQQRLMQLEQQYPQFSQQNNYQNVPQQQIGIQGKIVSDFETVKSTETPLDGSVSYFPLSNGEYIYTKFLNMNTGLSDYAVYKKVTNEEQKQGNTKEEDFNIKEYLDEKFEMLKQELLNGGLSNNARKSSKSNNKSIDEQRVENNN
jgi:hypothetical protein